MNTTYKKDEQYIIDECDEISLGEQEGWTHKIFAIFPAFQYKNYQLYFVGQLISLVGTWLQMVAQGWLVLQLTNSALWVGATAAMGLFPILIFALFGGVIVDRFPKRSILLFTQTCAMSLALMLGILTIFEIVTPYHILFLAFLLGTVSALDTPARQSFAVKLVDREHLTSALALNSGIFNAARVIGPGMAGIIIGLIGVGGAFIVNGLSYLAVIIALLLMKVHEEIHDDHPHPIQAIKDGLAYSFSHPTIRILLFFVAVTSIFGWSYSTIMPVIVRDVFHLGASGLGYLNAVSGVGALIATILVSASSHKINPRLFILSGSITFSTTLLLFSFSSSIITAIPLLLIMGFALILQFSTINSTIQHMVDDTIRGRVMSIYVIMFMGLAPLGSLQIGFLAEHFGPQIAIRMSAIIVLICAVMLSFKKKLVQD